MEWHALNGKTLNYTLVCGFEMWNTNVSFEGICFPAPHFLYSIIPYVICACVSSRANAERVRGIPISGKANEDYTSFEVWIEHVARNRDIVDTKKRATFVASQTQILFHWSNWTITVCCGCYSNVEWFFRRVMFELREGDSDCAVANLCTDCAIRYL